MCLARITLLQGRKESLDCTGISTKQEWRTKVEIDCQWGQPIGVVGLTISSQVQLHESKVSQAT